LTVKTDVSRFHIHDELTAPDESAPLLHRALAAGGSVSNLVGVLAGSPYVLRAFTRLRGELRGGELPMLTRHRIALAISELRGDEYSLGLHAAAARAAGLGIDEVSKARSFTSGDPREAGLLAYLRAAVTTDGPPPVHLHEEARELDWTDGQILEAIAHAALSEFQSLIANAAELPQDLRGARSTVLPSAA